MIELYLKGDLRWESLLISLGEYTIELVPCNHNEILLDRMVSRLQLQMMIDKISRG
jgi:hypothetical protein